MSETKSCNLTEEELHKLISWHGNMIGLEGEPHIERINYLHKRLKAFKEPEKVEPVPVTGPTLTPTTPSSWPTA